ncbi:DUF262 domain-containing protein [Ponticoccus gilvus]|nr:DUF262 domain-containing protein [Enemella evansiae]
MAREQQDFFDDDPSAEGGDDFRVSPKDFEETYIIPVDWTVSTLRRELDRVIDLSPAFQRRSVWSKKSKSRFIESLILGIPIPQILLAEESEERNSYLVLDGKQRLSTIREFFEGKFEDGSPFKLQGLDDMEELNGKTWRDLEHHHPREARAIEACSIRTAIIRGWRNEDVLYEIFYRLNSGSVSLSPMELRMSLIRGPFVRDVIRQSSECENLQKALNLRSADKRMKDVEIAVRFMAFHDRSVPYKGNLKVFLDEYCKLRNKDFEENQKIEELDTLELAIRCGLKEFSTKNFSRKFLPKERRYERPFNRAIFDCLGGSLASPDVREYVESTPGEMKTAFESTCENPEFVRHIEATTKTIEATKGRFEIWYDQVEVYLELN